MGIKSLPKTTKTIKANQYMLDVFENNKNKIIIGGVVLVILFVSYNIFSSDEDPIIVKLIQKEILQEVPKQIENPQIEEKGIITPKVEKKIIVKKVEEKIEDIAQQEQEIIPYDPEPKDEEITLYSTKDNTGRYTINLKSKIKVKPKNTYIVKYIMFNGIIENNSETSQFAISLNQDYLDFANDIFFDLKDITNENNESAKCDGGFLYGLDINSIYGLKIEVISDELSCYITSTKQLPKFLLDSYEDKPITAEELNITAEMNDSKPNDRIPTY